MNHARPRPAHLQLSHLCARVLQLVLQRVPLHLALVLTARRCALQRRQLLRQLVTLPLRLERSLQRR